MEKLRNDILAKMRSTLSAEQLEELARTMDICFYDYEILEKSRELATCGDINDIVLKNYLGTKLGQGLSVKTVEMYQYTIKRLLDDINKPVTEIKTEDIRYHLAKWQMERKASNVTINNMRRYYSGFFKWLTTEEIITRNPMDRIGGIKIPKKHKAPFTEKELELLFGACKTVRDRAVLEFLYSTGARASEFVKAEINDIDFRQNAFKIRGGKGGKDRIVYISARAMVWLEKYLDERTDNQTCLWMGRRGQLTKAGLEALVRRVGKEAGVEDAHPHKFRHTLASDMIKRDAPLPVVKEILGHESIDTTMLYVTMMDGESERIYKKLIA